MSEWDTYDVTGFQHIRIQIRSDAQWPFVKEELRNLGLVMSLNYKRKKETQG